MQRGVESRSWLQVFTSANTAHLGHSGGQERWPGVMASEKYAARRGSVEDGMRLITACFARVPQRWTSRIYIHFLLMFQERSEEHTSELQSQSNLVCRLLLEKK